MQQQMYEVHPSQLRWAMHNLAQGGVPIQGYSQLPNGMCVIVVLVPDGAPSPDWRAEPQRGQQRPRRWPRVDPVQAAQWLGVAAFAAGLIWFAWSLFAAPPAEPPASETANAWDWLDNLRLPWQPEPLPDGEPVVLPADDAGFRWPWDAAADAAADTADAAASVQGSITAAAGAVLAVLMMLIILSIARRRP